MEDENLPLRRRVPGAARAAPAPSGRPVLSDSVLQRMQAAVDAAKEAAPKLGGPAGPGTKARSGAPAGPAGPGGQTDREPVTEPIPRIGAPAASARPTASSPAAAGNATADADPAAGRRAGQRPYLPRPKRAPKRKRMLTSANPADSGRSARPEATGATRHSFRSKPTAEPRDTTPPTRTVPTPAPGSEPTLLPDPIPPEPRPVPLPKRAVAAPAAGSAQTPPAAAPAAAAGPAEAAVLPTRTPPAAQPQSPRPAAGAGPGRAGGPSEVAGPAAVADTAPATRPAGPAPAVRPPAPAPVARPAESAAPFTRASDTTSARSAGTEAAAKATAPPARPATPAAPARLRPGNGTRRRGRRAALVATAAVVAVAAVAVAWSFAGAPSAVSGGPKLTALQRLEAANRRQAATWVAAEVSHSASVACDPQMCSAIEAAGFPAAEVSVLGPTASYPRSSALVIETASVRGLFGTSLNSQVAPIILTSIGSGPAQIVIRLIAAHGIAAYEHDLRADLLNRKQDGAALVASSHIMTSATARKQMDAGQVDTRLLFAISALAAADPVDIVGFGNVATGGSADVPLRYADLAEHDPAAAQNPAGYLNSLVGLLRKLPSEWRPVWAKPERLPGGLAVLRVNFSAPTPLLLLGPSGQPGSS
jgi:hypothetical protein